MNWTALPFKGRLFILVAVLAAVPLFAVALWDILWHPSGVGYNWLILTALTLVTVPIFISLPSVSTSVGIGDAFVISISMLYGSSPAILANTLYTTFQALLLRKKHKVIAYRIIFNVAAAVINVSLYSVVFSLLNPTRSVKPQDILIPTFGLAVSFFLSNSFLVATAVALTSRMKLLVFWAKNYRALILDFIVSACAGAFIVLFQEIGVGLPLLIAPFV